MTNRTDEWQEALSKFHPIVTDCALDSLEDEAQARWLKSSREDQFLANVITALRSMRQTVNRMETAWGIVNSVHADVLLQEIAVRDAAIAALTKVEKAAA